MTRTSAKGWLKNILITVILVTVVSIAVDIWRNKDLTVSVANHSVEKNN